MSKMIVSSVKGYLYVFNTNNVKKLGFQELKCLLRSVELC